MHDLHGGRHLHDRSLYASVILSRRARPPAFANSRLLDRRMLEGYSTSVV